jgi:hypothetical protein
MQETAMKAAAPFVWLRLDDLYLEGVLWQKSRNIFFLEDSHILRMLRMER